MQENEKPIEIIKNEIKPKKPKYENFSFSKLDTYLQCPYRFDLKYNKKNYGFAKSLALEMGTLVHYINENIAQLLINGKPIDYDFWKKEIFEINKPNTSTTNISNEVKGVNILEEEYLRKFVSEGKKSGLTYSEKVDEYISHLNKLEKMHKESDWEILAVEVPFSFVHMGRYQFKGFIDRIDKNKTTGDIRVIDYKTKDAPFEHKDLTTPMQMVIYAIACVELYKKMPVEFIYDLPFLDLEQQGGTKGFVDRGTKKLTKTLLEIEDNTKTGIFKPKPTPLCYWCEFSASNPDAPKETKNLCPYYSLWTPSNRNFGVNKIFDEKENSITSLLEKDEKTNQVKIKSRLITADDINLDDEDF